MGGPRIGGPPPVDGRGLADEFGVTPTQISYVVNRKQWRDVV